MKIVEKKCPNCGANLKFKPGEHDARCESCRREFVIEYEADDLVAKLKEASSKFNPDDFNLVPAAKVFGTIFAVHSIIIAVISIIIFGAVIFGIIHAVKSFNQINQTDSSLNSREEYNKSVEEMNEEYQKALDELNKRYQESVENNQ